MYKFVSVGQDTQVALWEFEAPDELEEPLWVDKTGAGGAGGGGRPRHRRWVSTGGTNSTPMKLSFDGMPGGTAAIAIPSSPGAQASSQAPPAPPTPTQAQAGGGGGGGGGGSLIADSVPRAQMEMIPSVVQQEAHNEPLSSILKVGDGVITLCYGGILKFWKHQA